MSDGREHLRLSEALLVFVDVQNDYCHPDGALGKSGHDLSDVPAAVERCIHAQRLAHRAGVPVVHVRTEHSSWTDSDSWRARGVSGGTLAPDEFPIVRSGSWGAEPYRLREEAGELVLLKHRYSAFSYTPLELVMHARKRSRLLIAGVTTDMCVRATAIDAQARDFMPYLLTDASATTGASAQVDACRVFEAFHGPVVAVDDMFDRTA